MPYKRRTCTVKKCNIKFPDFDSAVTFYESEEYSQALKFALAEGVSTRNYTIVEGV